MRDAAHSAQSSAAQRDSAGGERDQLSGRMARANERVEELERQIAQVRVQRDGIEQASSVSRGEQRSRIRELDQLVSTLSVTLASTRSDIARAEASRAWRLGHGAMRLANQLRMRPNRTQGALQAALRRIDELTCHRCAAGNDPPAADRAAGPAARRSVATGRGDRRSARHPGGRDPRPARRRAGTRRSPAHLDCGAEPQRPQVPGAHPRQRASRAHRLPGRRSSLVVDNG